jgi:hypothetical protein
VRMRRNFYALRTFPQKLSWSEKLVTDFLKAPVRCVHSYDVCTAPKFRITVLCGGTSCSFEEPLVSEETAVSNSI